MKGLFRWRICHLGCSNIVVNKRQTWWNVDQNGCFKTKEHHVGLRLHERAGCAIQWVPKPAKGILWPTKDSRNGLQYGMSWLKIADPPKRCRIETWNKIKHPWSQHHSQNDILCFSEKQPSKMSKTQNTPQTSYFCSFSSHPAMMYWYLSRFFHLRSSTYGPMDLAQKCSPGCQPLRCHAWVPKPETSVVRFLLRFFVEKSPCWNT